MAGARVSTLPEGAALPSPRGLGSSSPGRYPTCRRSRSDRLRVASGPDAMNAVLGAQTLCGVLHDCPGQDELYFGDDFGREVGHPPTGVLTGDPPQGQASCSRPQCAPDDARAHRNLAIGSEGAAQLLVAFPCPGVGHASAPGAVSSSPTLGPATFPHSHISHIANPVATLRRYCTSAVLETSTPAHRFPSTALLRDQERVPRARRSSICD